MAKGHNARERGLLSAIQEKNELAARFRGLARDISRWTRRMGRKRSLRWHKRYSSGIRQRTDELKSLRPELLRRCEDLEKRIRDETKISGAEVRVFQEQYRKEVEELREARARLERAGQAWAPSDPGVRTTQGVGTGEGSEEHRASSLIEGLRKRRRKAYLEARKEAKDVEAVQRELTSEERDRELFDLELRKVLQAIDALSGGPRK